MPRAYGTDPLGADLASRPHRLGERPDGAAARRSLRCSARSCSVSASYSGHFTLTSAIAAL